MKAAETGLEGLVIIEPEVFRDQRGFFTETYNKRRLAQLGITTDFVQDNHSRSSRGVLRGVHYQNPPASQAKLVRCTAGVIYDVAVDLRAGSTTFGQWRAADLSAENMTQIFVPIGFGHAFLVLSDWAEVQYKSSDFYNPATEGAVRWDDPELDIDWPISNPVLSPKDRVAQTFKEYRRIPAFLDDRDS